jgi:hypothetical protein
MRTPRKSSPSRPPPPPDWPYRPGLSRSAGEASACSLAINASAVARVAMADAPYAIGWMSWVRQLEGSGQAAGSGSWVRSIQW